MDRSSHAAAVIAGFVKYPKTGLRLLAVAPRELRCHVSPPEPPPSKEFFCCTLTRRPLKYPSRMSQPKSTASARMHVALRIRPKVTIRWQDIDVFQEHNNIIAQEGSVALAKFAGDKKRPNMTGVLAAIEAGHTPFLYLVFKQNAEYKSVRAPVSQILFARDPHPFQCPRYYTDLQLTPSLWFILSSPLEPSSLEGLHLLTNGRPLQQVLAECRTVMMMVASRDEASRRGLRPATKPKPEPEPASR